MKKFIFKVTAGLAAATIATTMFSSAVFADTNTIQGNGKNSVSFVTTYSTSNIVAVQKNKTIVGTTVVAQNNTGSNKVSGNTGGSNSITTKKASTLVNVGVTGGTNVSLADPNCGCMPTDNTNTIQGNGEKSVNMITTTMDNSNVQVQKNTTVVSTTVIASNDTGNNQVKGNTGGANSVDTGAADTTVNVSVTGNSNTSL